MEIHRSKRQSPPMLFKRLEIKISKWVAPYSMEVLCCNNLERVSDTLSLNPCFVTNEVSDSGLSDLMLLYLSFFVYKMGIIEVLFS